MTFSKICRTCTYSIYRLGYMLTKMPIPFIVHSSHKSLQAKFRLRNQSKLAANWKQICSPKGCLKSATPTWLALTPLVKDEGAYASARVPHACHLAWNWNWSCRVKTASSAAASQPSLPLCNLPRCCRSLCRCRCLRRCRRHRRVSYQAKKFCTNASASGSSKLIHLIA